MINITKIFEQKDSKHAAGIAYIVDDELLCVKSVNGRWGIPKGHRHIDESPEDGAIREFTEETQIILNRPIKLSHIGKKKNGGDFHVFICQGDKKKFKVYVKNNKGNVVKVNFGQGGDAKGGTMRIRKSNPAARKSFRARHNCDNPGPKYKARYWACRTW